MSNWAETKSPVEGHASTAGELVFGLLDNSVGIDCPATTAKLRDLTISWSRYSYGGPIIEAPSIDAILAESVQCGFRYCFIQSYGHIIAERWWAEGELGGDILATLDAWIGANDFLVAGLILAGEERYGLDNRYLLVDLECYHRVGLPQFGEPQESPVELPKAEVVRYAGDIVALRPSDGVEYLPATKPGWNLIATSLVNQIPVAELGGVLAQHSLNLAGESYLQRQTCARYLDGGIEAYRSGVEQGGLSADQIEFFDLVDSQVSNAHRGVFLWNIESYEDIEAPLADFSGPISSLFSVAAGFKPNRILHMHGMSEGTRVVFFDYSANALEIRKALVEHWDGEDFPHFVKYLFGMFPSPQTFYHLWSGLTPDDLERDAIECAWQGELARWEGAQNFKTHWTAYRELSHEYLHCNIMVDSAELFKRVSAESNAVIWFSNAFFTVLSNWHYTLDQRKQIYQRWIAQLSALNPDLQLYGSDYCNSNVNCIRAETYWERYQLSGGSYLQPSKLGRYQIRM